MLRFWLLPETLSIDLEKGYSTFSEFRYVESWISHDYKHDVLVSSTIIMLEVS